MIPRNPDGSLGRPTNVIADAHRNGLEVIGWTFRRENQYLPLELRSSTDPNAPGDMRAEVERFLRAGMDSAFTDNPDVVTGVATPATSSPPARRAA
jgi:glycerophosphoryl diester phosphodiesterase